MGKVLNYKRVRISPFQIEDLAQNTACVELDDATDCYGKWPCPTSIISDGPYGLSKFPGDPLSTDSLAEMYAPHIAAWSKHALPETTLWFWCSELGWADVHPVLKIYGWKYKAAHIGDKGIGHVAGNCNGDSIRGFPVVSEICVQYVREARLKDANGEDVPLKVWLRREWQRSGLPLSMANDACGVKNAAPRKYFTQCHLWFFPPAEKMIALASYATKHGRETDRPYFSIDGKTPLTVIAWEKLRSKWNHSHGVTNIWSEPAVRGNERIRSNSLKAFHANQKPLKLMRRIIEASTEIGDVVWEPFGGLCSATVAAFELGRSGYAAELIPEFYDVACTRIKALPREWLIKTYAKTKSARS